LGLTFGHSCGAVRPSNQLATRRATNEPKALSAELATFAYR
jgi:hypothetical protein